MITEFIIPTHDIRWLFGIFYLLMVLVSAGAYLYEGLRLKYPPAKVLLTLTACVLFAIAGSKTGTYNADQWLSLLQTGHVPFSAQKSIFTAWLALFAGAIFAAHWLKFNPLIPDRSALAIPIGMAVLQFGCLSAGCCGGTVSFLPWSVRYDPGSLVCFIQQQHGHGFLPGSASLPVHPVPLYNILMLAVVFIILLKTYHRFTTPGSLRFFAMLLYLVTRFISEFFRDPATDHFGGEFFWGMKLLQWYLLAAMIIFAIFLYYWERVWKHSPWAGRSFWPDHMRCLTLTAALMIIYFFVAPTLEIAEILVLRLLLFSSVVTVVVSLFRAYRGAGQRSLAFALGFAGLFCLGQSDSLQNKGKNNYIEWNFNYNTGHYHHTINKVTGFDSDCSGTYPVLGPDVKSKRVINNGQLGFAYVGYNKKMRKNIFDLSLAIGAEAERNEDPGLSKSYGLFRVTTGYRYESRVFSIYSGFNIGQFYARPILDEPESIGDIDNVPKPIIFSSYLGIRMGEPLYFYMFGSVGEPAFICTSMELYKVGIGTGFGNPRFPSLELGYAESGFFFGTKIPFRQNLHARLQYLDDFNYENGNARAVSLGLIYRVKAK